MTKETWLVAESLVLNILLLAKQLHQQLSQEAEILKSSPQPANLDSVTDNKKQLVSRLEELNLQLSQVLAAEKLPNDQHGMNAFFQKAAMAGLLTPEMVNNWQHTQLICTECKMLNEHNGASIDLLSQHAKRSLDILKGKPHGTNIYGRDGVSQRDRLDHTLTFYL
jgi:flagellar biosynthesis protein FlgN